MKFELGQLVATPGALEALQLANTEPSVLVQRHLVGDWGIVNEADAEANEQDLLHGGRLLSAYKLWDQTEVWIVTEWDRSVTTILLPSEY